jgi:hypothetical protein
MRFHRRLSLRGKLTLVNMLTCVAALLLASVAFLVYDVYSFRARMVGDLETLSQVIGENCVAALLFDDATAAGQVLGALAARPAVESALLYRPSGQLLAQYASRPGVAGARPRDIWSSAARCWWTVSRSAGWSWSRTCRNCTSA